MTEKNYIVIGGSHGIGFGLVQRLLARDAHVTVLSRTAPQLGTDLNADCVTYIPFDVMTDEVPAGVFPTVIDGLAYCPGSITLGPLRGISAESMLADYRLNVIGAVKCVQASLAGMKSAQRSAIVMFSTVAVGQGLPMHVSVAAAKGAVEGLSRSMAAELAPKIRVNCIAPSLTDTPLASRLLSSEEKKTAMGKRHPLGRVGTVDDIASMAEFLLTDLSTWVTGQVIAIDGGMSALRI